MDDFSWLLFFTHGQRSGAYIETISYNSRSDFLKRLKAIVEALGKHIGPKVVDRLGLRYIDRISGEPMSQVSSLVRSEVLGIISTPLAKMSLHSLNESLFTLDDDLGTRVLTRWGQMPADGTVDPAAIEPIAEPSWILDFDMFSTKPQPFEVDHLIAKAHDYAERLYAFFRWAVTNEFLRQYGGDV